MTNDHSNIEPARPAAASLTYHRGDHATVHWSDIGGVAKLAAKGAVVAIAVTTFCLAWMPLNLPVVFILAGAGEGMMIGFGMRLTLRSSHVRSRSLAMTTTLATALLAVVLTYPGLYAWNITRLHAVNIGGRTVSAKQLYDLWLASKVGRGGVIGYLMLTLPNVSGTAFIHAALTPWSAWYVVRRQLQVARCPSCEAPLPEPNNAAVVSRNDAEPLVSAIAADDIDAVLAAVTASASKPLGNSCVIARAYRCRACGERAVDVIAKVFGRGQSSQSILLRPRPMTEPFYDALRSEPAIAVPGEGDGSDRPAPDA